MSLYEKIMTVIAVINLIIDIIQRLLRRRKEENEE